MKKRKNFILLGILLLVAVTSGVVAVTYSRYITSATGSSSATVAAWKISINGQNMGSSSNTFDSGDFIWTNNNAGGAVLADHIAPGVTGSTNIVLDATNTQVDVEYDITIDPTDLMVTFEGMSQIRVVIGTTDEVAGTVAQTIDFTSGVTDPITYSGSIKLSDVNKQVTVPVQIIWDNSESANADDTYIGSTIETIAIPVSVTVSQFVGA